VNSFNIRPFLIGSSLHKERISGTIAVLTFYMNLPHLYYEVTVTGGFTLSHRSHAIGGSTEL